MASCGKNVEDEIKDDEKYEDWSDDDLDPDNIVDIPTGNLCKSEMLILKDSNGNPIDRRVRVFFNRKEFHTTSYFMLSQLTIKLRSGNIAVGSAICVPLAKNPFFLTCAHNLVSLSSRRKWVSHKILKVYKARHGKDSYVVSGLVNERKILWHDKYDGYNGHGWDIGKFQLRDLKLGKFSQNSHGSMKTVTDDVMLHWANQDLLKKGMGVEIAGYPGKKEGYPYKHEGTIEDIKKTKYGSHLIWYNADTTEGNSGSCIMVTDQKFVKSVTKRPEIKRIIIGVHSGYDPILGLNYRTLITEGLYHWIKSN